MLNSAPMVRRVLAGALGAGAISGAVLFGAMPLAAAQPAPIEPPNCTSADFAGVASGVSASSSAYLFTHPEVNRFFTDLHGAPEDVLSAKVAEYFSAHPQVENEIRAIRQPLTDIKLRCGFSPEDPDGPRF